MLALLAGLVAFTVGPAEARLGPGSLDPSFGTGGVVTTDFRFRNDGASAVALQPDAKIVAVGGSSSRTDSKFALARYKPKGSLDTSFSGDGKVTTSIGARSDDGANALALQPDGKLVPEATESPKVAGRNPRAGFRPSIAG